MGDRWDEIDKTAPAPAAASTQTAPAAAASQSTVATPDRWEGIDKTAPPSIAKTTEPETTGKGIARNVAVASAEDVPAGMLNMLMNPTANLMYLPMKLGADAYDAVAPLLGGSKMSPDLRDALFGDYDKQQGNTAVNTAASTVGIPTQSEVTGTPTEQLFRRGAAAAEGGAIMGPSVPIGVTAGVAQTAAGEGARRLVPDQYKDVAEDVANVGTGAATIVAGNKLGGRPSALPTQQTDLINLGQDRYGIPLRAPATGLAKFSADMPFSGAPADAAKVASTWRTATAQHLLGEDTDQLTPGVMARVEQDAQDDIKSIGRSSTGQFVTRTPADTVALQAARDRYNNVQLLKGTVDPTTGHVDPNAFLDAVRKQHPDMDTIPNGQSAAVDLARMGQMLPGVAPHAASGAAQTALHVALAPKAAAMLVAPAIANRLGPAQYLRSNFRTNQLINRPAVNPYALPLLTNDLTASGNNGSKP